MVLSALLPVFTLVIADDQLRLKSLELDESSGLAQVGDELWSHNDSGDRPRFFVFDQRGNLLREVNVSGARAIDWEDMCAFTRQGQQYVAVGDVGDNTTRRPSVMIYVFRIESARVDRLRPLATLEVTYPDGPVNCEALAYDPVRDTFVLATKETLRCRLFEVPWSEPPTGKISHVAQWRLTLMLPLVTGGDIAPDGQRLVLTTYGPGFLLRRTGQNWLTAGEDDVQAIELPPRRQGESICFSLDGRRLWLSSEFAPSPLFEIEID